MMNGQKKQEQTDKSKYTGPLPSFYVFQVELMLGIDDVFDKPADLSVNDWDIALSSVVSKLGILLSDAQKEAIQPLKSFIKLSHINQFDFLRKNTDDEKLNSFAFIYDYIFWRVLHEISSPSIRNKIHLPIVDPILEKVPVGKLRDYIPTSKDYIEGFRCIEMRISKAEYMLLQEFHQYLMALKADPNIEPLDNHYDVMSYGIPTLSSVITLLKNDAEWSVEDWDQLKAMVGESCADFKEIYADFKNQLIVQLEERIIVIKLNKRIVLSSGVNACMHEDYVAILASIPKPDKVQIASQPGSFIPGYEKIAAANILAIGREYLQEYRQNQWGSALSQYKWLYFNIILAHFWLDEINGDNDNLTEYMSQQKTYKNIQKALAEFDDGAFLDIKLTMGEGVDWAIASDQLLDLIYAKSATSDNSNTQYLRYYFYLGIAFKGVGHATKMNRLYKALALSARDVHPIGSLALLYESCQRVFGGSTIFMEQFSEHVASDIHTFCAGFASTTAREDFFKFSRISEKLTLIDMMELAVRYSPASIFRIEPMLKRLEVLLIDESSVDTFVSHMQLNCLLYAYVDLSCMTNIKGSLKALLTNPDIFRAPISSYEWSRVQRSSEKLALKCLSDRIDKIFTKPAAPGLPL